MASRILNNGITVIANLEQTLNCSHGITATILTFVHPLLPHRGWIGRTHGAEHSPPEVML